MLEKRIFKLEALKVLVIDEVTSVSILFLFIKIYSCFLNFTSYLHFKCL